MTFDAVALCRDMPGPEIMLGAMLAAGGDLHVCSDLLGAVVLLDDLARPVLRVEGPRLVHTPGEAQRLLGITLEVPQPAWWVEVYAPDQDADAAAAARRVVMGLVELAGGCSWSTR